MDTTYIRKWYEEITEYLRMLVDSATNLNKVRVRFIKQLSDSAKNQAVLSFNPSSALCDIAHNLVQRIFMAVVDDPEVSSQQVIILGQLTENELTIEINQEK